VAENLGQISDFFSPPVKLVEVLVSISSST